MNRPIKFRAWEKWEKRMLYRGVFDINWYATEKNDENGCHTVRGIKPEDKTELELMQFTGLLDKNGKEIYEGDIILHTNEEADKSPSQILWNTYEGQWQTENIHAQRGGQIADSEWYDWDTSKIDNIEVIGNIYENPELLK